MLLLCHLCHRLIIAQVAQLVKLKLTFICVGVTVGTMEDDKRQFDIHRYGLRMPKSLFKLIEDVAWDSRLSVNFTILELIRRSLVDLIAQNADFKPDYTFQNFLSPIILDVNFKSLKDLYENDEGSEEKAEQYEKRKKQIDDTFRELLDWVELNK